MQSRAFDEILKMYSVTILNMLFQQLFVWIIWLRPDVYYSFAKINKHHNAHVSIKIKLLKKWNYILIDKWNEFSSTFIFQKKHKLTCFFFLHQMLFFLLLLKYVIPKCGTNTTKSCFCLYKTHRPMDKPNG